MQGKTKAKKIITSHTIKNSKKSTTTIILHYFIIQGGNEHGGGGFGRSFPQNDRFRMGGRDQSIGGGPQRPLIPPIQAQQLPPPIQQIDANDCEIVVTAKHLT